MNFNNINGVWPQIKDYIDSKLGGGTSKYKHMIYVNTLNSDLPIHNAHKIGAPDGGLWCRIIEGAVYYGPISMYIENYENGSYGCMYQSYFNFYGGDASNSNETVKKFGTKLPEGWYMNYMGQIYDWKGNIVE